MESRELQVMDMQAALAQSNRELNRFESVAHMDEPIRHWCFSHLCCPHVRGNVTIGLVVALICCLVGVLVPPIRYQLTQS